MYHRRVRGLQRRRRTELLRPHLRRDGRGLHAIAGLQPRDRAGRCLRARLMPPLAQLSIHAPHDAQQLLHLGIDLGRVAHGLVGAANQRNWERLLEAMGIPEMAMDPRFHYNHGRMANLKALEEGLNQVFRKRTTAEWLECLKDAGIPAGPMLNIAEMHRHPQTQAREMVTEVEHPHEGKAVAQKYPLLPSVS